MKILLSFSLLTILMLSHTLTAQSLPHAPEFPQCLADYHLWSSQRNLAISKTDGNVGEASAKSLEEEHDEMLSCTQAYATGDTPIGREPCFWWLSFQLDADVNVRRARFLIRHHLFESYDRAREQFNAWQRSQIPDIPDWIVAGQDFDFSKGYFVEHRLATQFYAEDEAGKR